MATIITHTSRAKEPRLVEEAQSVFKVVRVVGIIAACMILLLGFLIYFA